LTDLEEPVAASRDEDEGEDEGLREGILHRARSSRWVREAAGRPRLTSWVLVSLGLGVYFLLAGNRAFKYDSWLYWLLKDSFDSPFGVLDFDDGLRGYSFPWHLHLFERVVSPVIDGDNTVVRAFSLLVLPFLLCVVVPTLARRISPAVKVTVPRVVGGSALFLVLWRSDMLYPLADLPALLLMATAATLLVARRSVTTALVAGVAFGFAVNYRPAYLASVVVATALLFLLERERRPLVLRTTAVAVGLVLTLAPQVAINQRHYDMTTVGPAASSELALFQLELGLRFDRYETYYGTDPGITEPRLIFPNAALNDELGASKIDSTGEYLRFALEHPVDAAGSYGRHLFNGLDARFGGSAVEDLGGGSIVLPALNYLVLALAVLLLVTRWLRRDSTVWRGPTTWLLAVLVVSVAPGVVGATEARFLLPLHLALIFVVALTFRRRDVPAGARARVVTGLGLAAVVVACFGLSAATLASNWSGPILVDGRYVKAPSVDPAATTFRSLVPEDRTPP
jgi:hypothetical protein